MGHSGSVLAIFGSDIVEPGRVIHLVHYNLHLGFIFPVLYDVNDEKSWKLSEGRIVLLPETDQPEIDQLDDRVAL